MPNQSAYGRTKAVAAASAGQSAPLAATPRASSPKAGVPLIASGDPDISPAWTGLTDPNVTPPDTTGAIGPSRYIELVNDKYGIYDRNGNVVATGGLRGLAGANTDCVTDPQVIWDPQTKRFYYVVLEFSHFVGFDCESPPGPPNDENRLYIGFSRTSTPSNGSSSWCKYALFYQNPFTGFDPLPDYPKLGDNSAFLLFGSNLFDNLTGNFMGADVAWLQKPGAGTSCPPLGANTYFNATGGPLLQHDGVTQAFTPVPANQTDTSPTGYVVAAASPFVNSPANFLDTYPVSTNFGNPVGAPVAHSVTAFDFPPSAPQSGTSEVLDTLDARLTNSVSGLDPSKSTTAIWTQHTVLSGGGRSEVRWYELGAGSNPPLRSGTISDGSLYTFNAAISPDRKVSGSTKRFGDAFVVGFNTSSASDFVRIQMVSQWADNAMSEFVEVKASPGYNFDFSCASPSFPCRWGDYSGATPDPASNQYSNHGRVWLSNQWNVASNNDDADWRTYNWGTNPVPYVVLNGPTTLFQKGKSFAVKWFLGNQASVADVQYRDAPWNGSFGAPILWKSKAPAGGATFTGSFGHTYCFSAESFDDVAGPGFRGWGFGPERCAVVPLDDRALSASSGWSRLNGSGFFNNTYTKTTLSGKSLTKTGIHAKRAQIMVETCPTCGSIKIYWNGSLKHTYSLHAGSTHKKVYLAAVSFSSVHTGTLKIVVSSSGKPVIIDALAVSAV
ncbi:MAG TPA: hypothetical protein VGL18_05215 [Actinomycetota bacterium]